MSNNIERCTKCGSTISEAEIPHIWREAIVCQGCYERLAKPATPATAPPPRQAPKPIAATTPMAAPSASAVSALSQIARAAQAPLAGAPTAQVRPEPSRARRLAARSCIVLSILQYLGGGLMGLGTVGIIVAGAQHSPKLPSGASIMIGIAMLMMAVLCLAVATAYLVCGLKMRRGGLASVIVALVLASLSELGALFLTVAGLVGEVQTEMAGGHLAGFVMLGIYLLAIAAFGQLIFFLVQVLREPRGNTSSAQPAAPAGEQRATRQAQGAAVVPRQTAPTAALAQAPCEPFVVHVTTLPASSAKGKYQCALQPAKIVLTAKNKPAIELPVGAAIRYGSGKSFTATSQGRTLTITVRLLTKFSRRLTHDLVDYLEGRTPMPRPADYALPWYFYITIFLPLAIPVLTLGGAIPVMIAGGMMTLCGYLAQQEKWNIWLRLGLSVGVNAVGYIAITVLLVTTFLAQRHTAPGAAGASADPGQSAAPVAAPSNWLSGGPAEADYCTIVLAPRLQTELGLDGADVLQRVQMYAWQSQVWGAVYGPDDNARAGMVNAHALEESARKRLAEIGQAIHARLTADQDRQFHALVASGAVRPVQVAADIEPSAGTTIINGVKREGVEVYHGLNLTFTNYKDRPIPPRVHGSRSMTHAGWRQVNWRQMITTPDEAITVLTADHRELHEYGAMWVASCPDLIPAADRPRVAAALQQALAAEPDGPQRSKMLLAVKVLDHVHPVAPRVATPVAPPAAAPVAAPVAPPVAPSAPAESPSRTVVPPPPPVDTPQSSPDFSGPALGPVTEATSQGATVLDLVHGVCL